MLLRAAPYSPLRNHRPHAARSVKPMANYDWRVSVPASGEQRGHTFFVAVRPHVAMFLRAVSKWYEVVVFTASLQVLLVCIAGVHRYRDRGADAVGNCRGGGRRGESSKMLRHAHNKRERRW